MKSQSTAPAVYVRVGAARQPIPFEDMTLPQKMNATVLRQRQPMRVAELTVAMLEAGYQTSMRPKNLRVAVGAALWENGRFIEANGLWAEFGSWVKNVLLT